MLKQFPLETHNPNLRWALLFVDALARSGLSAVCIAPGSRSTPLTLAFDAHPDIQVFVHLDERSGAFFALGLALATDRPVALVCTSGTAAANFYPAIVEANMSHVPLLVLTTDRPPELRHSGANQTIDQIKLYGDHVLWSVDMALPQADAPEIALRNVQTTAARAYATAAGLVKGPVHVNFPFRKPLEPESRAQVAALHNQVTPGATHTQHATGVLHPTPDQVDQLTALIQQHARGLIVCGPRCPAGDFPQAVAALSRWSGYPILADPLSGVRFGPWTADTAVLGGYETFLAGHTDPGWGPPDVVIRFGNVPTSKWLNAYLDRITPRYRLHVKANGRWADDGHRTTHFWQVDETVLCRQVGRGGRARDANAGAWAQQVQATEAACWEQIEALLAKEFFDAAAVAQLLAHLPEGANLVMGNSLPIRHLDQFGRPAAKRVRVFGNRGASGIDGNISTALGIAAAAPARPTYLVTGDITFYHDMNGLLAARQNSVANIGIILLNNNGGGIFNRLPVSKIEPPFTALFTTPHHLDFRHAAELYGFHYVCVETAQHFIASVSSPPSAPSIIEVRTEGRADEKRRTQIIEQILRDA